MCQGTCTHEECPYLHKAPAPGARVCQDFLGGYCARGAGCPDKHLTVRMMRDMREQGANILAIANAGDRVVAGLATYTLVVEEMREELLTICEVIPLQFLAYFMAVNSGIDVDRPRNLTKAVLSE